MRLISATCIWNAAESVSAAPQLSQEMSDDTSTIWFKQFRVARAGVVDPCPNNCFTFMETTATVRVSQRFPVRNLKCECATPFLGGNFSVCLSEVSQYV